jgi:hypothetical protein
LTDNYSSVQGVAPDAKLLAYKTFSALYDYTRDDILIEAFLMAYEAGADVISASIAAANVWYPLSIPMYIKCDHIGLAGRRLGYCG